MVVAVGVVIELEVMDQTRGGIGNARDGQSARGRSWMNGLR